ncbi:MAG TPA: AI-2E family transporter [Pseudonocardiaceae bacterium]|nr:AI-2E family transporter [Pseudonocardiaceae bacterium]
MTDQHVPEPATPPLVPPRADGLLRAGRVAWSVLGIVAVAVVAWLVLSRLAVVVVPLLLALFPAAALAPVVRWMVRHRIPPALATLLTLIGLLAVVGGLIAALIPQFVAQLPVLADSLSHSVRQLQPLLDRIPGLPQDISIRELAQRVGGFGDANMLRIAVGYTRSAAEFLGGLLLLVIALFVYLYDGDRLARAGVGLLPRRHRATALELGGRLWDTLGSFVRAQLAVATVDAMLIGIGLVLLGIPLALPLAMLVFLGAFFPYVGATVSGLLAVGVAFADGGPGMALAVLALVVGVQQLEGNLVQPYIAGRMVQVRPFAVIVALGIGGTLLGVLGVFLAVPAAACLARMAAFVREQEAGSELPAASAASDPDG